MWIQPMVLVAVNVLEALEATVTIVDQKERVRKGLVSPAFNALIPTKDPDVDRVLMATKAMVCAALEEQVASTDRVILVSRNALSAPTDKRKLIHDWLVRSSTIRLVTGL